MEVNLENSAPIVGLSLLAAMLYFSSVGLNVATLGMTFLSLRHMTSSLIMSSIDFLNSSFFTWSAMSNAFGKLNTRIGVLS